jgi:hypothetical protein
MSSWEHLTRHDEGGDLDGGSLPRPHGRAKRDRDLTSQGQFSGLQQTLLDRYQRDGFLLAGQLVSAQQAESFLLETAPLTAQRVSCGRFGVSWKEQAVPVDTSLHGFFVDATTLISGLIFPGATPPPAHLQCWTSIYNSGEYINAHRDGVGALQIVLCLESSGSRMGGMLGLQVGHELVRLLDLRPGDAAIFDATRVEHFTTPVAPSSECRHPRRVVAVARYSFATAQTPTEVSSSHG